MRDCRSNNQTPCEMHFETDGKPIFAWHVRKFCRITCSRSALLSHGSSSSPTWGRPNLDRRSGWPHSWKILGILWVMRLHLTPCFWLWDHLTRKLFKQSTLTMGWILGQSKETASNMSNVQPRIQRIIGSWFEKAVAFCSTNNLIVSDGLMDFCFSKPGSDVCSSSFPTLPARTMNFVQHLSRKSLAAQQRRAFELEERKAEEEARCQHWLEEEMNKFKASLAWLALNASQQIIRLCLWALLKIISRCCRASIDATESDKASFVSLLANSALM